MMCLIVVLIRGGLWSLITIVSCTGLRHAWKISRAHICRMFPAMMGMRASQLRRGPKRTVGGVLQEAWHQDMMWAQERSRPASESSVLHEHCTVYCHSCAAVTCGQWVPASQSLSAYSPVPSLELPGLRSSFLLWAGRHMCLRLKKKQYRHRKLKVEGTEG